ncbi:MAG: hypothetical protein V4671_07695 [Armatimonadota bacterium]
MSTVTPAAGTAAENFLASELAQAKRSLLMTRIFSGGAALFVLFYLGYVTSRFQESMRPANAAEIAQGIVAERVDTNATAIAEEVRRRVPTLIEELPGYAIKQMPDYRQQLEDQIVSDISGYSAENAPKLGEHLEEFLQAHKDEVKQMIDDGQNPEIIDRVGGQLEQEFMESLKATDAGGGETYREKLDKSLASLEDIHKKMDHLAANKNLTPSETKTRRAIAILAGKINMATVTPASKALTDGAASLRKGAEAAVTTTP